MKSRRRVYYFCFSHLPANSTDDGSMWWRTIPGFVNNIDGTLLDDDDPFDNAAIVIGGCENIDAESGGVEPEPLTIAICTTVSVGIALIGGIVAALNCSSDANNCRDVAHLEMKFCMDRCDDFADYRDFQECLDCCADRREITIVACGNCGDEFPNSGDFATCYEDAR